MPYLNNIVCKLNEGLKRSALKNGFIDTIAYQVVKKSDEGDQIFPAIYNGGNAEYIGIDDSNPVIVYHRLLRNAYRKSTTYNDRFVQTAQMVMVVYANYQQVNATPDRVEALVIRYLPTQFAAEDLDLAGMNFVNVQILGSDMNPRNVWATEYANVPYRIGIEQIYFSITYNLEIQFDITCLEC